MTWPMWSGIGDKLKPLPASRRCHAHDHLATCLALVYGDVLRVVCRHAGPIMCYGPARKTARGAINAWNKQEDGQ